MSTVRRPHLTTKQPQPAALLGLVSCLQSTLPADHIPASGRHHRRTSQRKFSERSFSYAGPAACNTLPEHIHATSDPAHFRCSSKMNYFRLTLHLLICFYWLYNAPAFLV